MKFLARLLGRTASKEQLPAVNFERHDEIIGELQESVRQLKRLQSDPISARVRGQYSPRRIHRQEPTR